ncbi:MAG TPA: FKBP-type peptidyl-prolyl cis-trans isomerase [Candidatus Saccharimonadales bacterium]|nr:FKBP-type peptidyl-prolyl cis-trans isomerase [Candidatus Saccharimonadales bacterium]
MARMRERIFAGLGAVLFLGSASALTVFAISQGGGSSPQAQTQQACTDSQTEPTLAVPDAYTPTEPVTELQTTDLVGGHGSAAKKGDCLVMKYYGTLASDGTKFDENFTGTTGFAFTLGQGQVISGWDQGLVGIKAGGTRRLVIPASMAYGDQAQGSIPANSDLVFVVKLLRIQK